MCITAQYSLLASSGWMGREGMEWNGMGGAADAALGAGGGLYVGYYGVV